MKHGDTIKLHINNSLIEAVFHGWESGDIITFKAGREEFVTHYGSVVEINGEVLC